MSTTATTESAITITGYSDDVVQIEGPGVVAEIDCYAKPVTLAFSDGTALTFEWCPKGNEGHGWKATVVERGTATLNTIEATDPEGSWPEYTDQVTIGPVNWVEHTNADKETPVSRWEI